MTNIEQECPGLTVDSFTVSESSNFKGAFHLSEMTGQAVLVVTRISPLIKTIKPDQSNAT